MKDESTANDQRTVDPASSDPGGAEEMAGTDAITAPPPVTVPQELPAAPATHTAANGASVEAARPISGAEPAGIVRDELAGRDALEERVRDLERELRETRRQLARVIAKRDEAMAEALRHKGAAARRSAQVREAREAVDAAERSLQLERRRLRVLQKEHVGLQSNVETLRGRVGRLVAENSALKTDIERLNAASGLQLFSNARALQWLTRTRRRPQLDLRGGIVVVGAGPVPKAEMERLLRKAGFQLRKPGDTSAASMVTGRDDWLVDDLEDQIAARKSQRLKVFSQEMLIAALATRDDPFESADRKTLLAFADGHDALTYLIEAGFEWPFITWKPLQAAGRFAEKQFAEESPVHKMGYVVGKVAGLPEKARRRILADAFTGKLPKVYSTEYMATWGTPGGRIRLRRMATHLATFARLWQNEPNFGTAVAHWEADLDWLEQEFYEPWMRFRWPETQA